MLTVHAAIAMEQVGLKLIVLRLQENHVQHVMVVEKCVVIAVMGMATHHVAGAQEMDIEVAMYAREMVEFILWENI